MKAFILNISFCILAIIVNAQTPCDAQISSVQNPPSAISPYNYTFTASPNNINIGVSYTWDFGLGFVSTDNPATVSFFSPGIQIVTLVVSDSVTACNQTYTYSLLISQSTPYNCYLDVFATTSGSDVNLSAEVIFQASPGVFNWEVTDPAGQIFNLSGQYPSFSAQMNGDYYACVDAQVVSANDSCDVFQCTNFNVSGIPGGNNNFCDAVFSITQDPMDSLTYSFTPTWASPNTVQTFNWNMGDGTVYNTFTVNHTYQNLDSATTICLEIVSLDPITGQYCSDIHCNTIGGFVTTPWPPSIDSCAALFTYYFAPNTGFHFQAIGVSNASTQTYDWDMGDGTTYSANVFPVHNFANYGTYNVCLTVSDSLIPCSNTSCQAVDFQSTFGGGNNFGYGINGSVNLAGNDFAIVYLIEFDAVDSSLNVANLALADYFGNGDFYFANVPNGDYLIKAALIPGSEFYWDYLPTYYGDVELWSDAQFLTIYNSDANGVFINLIQGNNPGGPGFIGGLISDGAGKTNGEPLAEVEVILFDENMNPVAYTYSDANGNYSFENIEFGTYWVTADLPGMEFNTIEIIISDDNTTANEVEISTGNQIILNLETSEMLDFTVFPNPSTDVIYVSVNETKATNFHFEIIDSKGSILKSKHTNANQTKISLEELSSGIYILNVKSNERLIGIKKFTVQ